MKAWKHKCTGVVDISQVRSRRPNQSMPNPKKNYQRQIPNPQKIRISLKDKSNKFQKFFSILVSWLIFSLSKHKGGRVGEQGKQNQMGRCWTLFCFFFKQNKLSQADNVMVGLVVNQSRKLLFFFICIFSFSKIKVAFKGVCSKLKSRSPKSPPLPPNDWNFGRRTATLL